MSAKYGISQSLIMLLLLALLFAGNATADNGHTRGIGVYPGRMADYRGPQMTRSNEYRNMALHRMATASSSIDYNLTAQLATDGIVGASEPTRLSVSVNGSELPLRDKEKTLDGNVHTCNILEGELATIQYDWTGMDISLDTLRLLAEVVYHPENAGSCSITVLGSADGKLWQEIGRNAGEGLPGLATRQSVSSDPNKQESTIRLPLRLVVTDIALKSQSSNLNFYRHLRVEFRMKGCAYWRLYEVDNGGKSKYGFDNSKGKSISRQNVNWHVDNGLWLPSAHFASAWVADGRTDATPWLQVDLGAEAEIDKLVFHWIHKPATCEVLVSSNGTSWEKVQISNLKSQTSNLNARGRYVRLEMSRPDDSGLFALAELEVWGKGGLEPEVEAKGEGISAWQLRRDGDSQWIPATVPGTVLTSYMNIEAVPNNVYANNMRQISESFFNSDFWYRANINVDKPGKGRHTYLCFDGINWKAEVWLNGKHLGRIDGAFMRGKFDVTKLLRKGDNDLQVKIIKNAHFGVVKVKNAENTDINGGVLGADNPTFHASIGWDWITSTPGREAGIWNDVYLVHDCGVSVADPIVTTKLGEGTGLASMTASVVVNNNDNRRRKIRINGWIGEIKFTKETTLEALEEREVAFTPADFPQLRNRKMRLWWPNGYGEPYLYDAGFCIDGDEEGAVHFKAGIREMSYETIDTQTKIFVNGKRLVPLGGNWGFSEANLNYRTREYDAAVRYQKETNFNMLRNWVGQIGDEELYEACDKYGIMVWQDFWLANPWDGPNPYDNAMFLANSRDLIKKIRRHPCIAIYVGRNEGFPPETLDRSLRKQVEALHPQLAYIPSSADGGVSGHGPYRMMPVKYYFENQPHKLHSERGMPNVPTIDGLRRMIEPDRLWPIGEAWGRHDFTMQGAQGGASFCDILERRIGKPTDEKQFTQWAQWLNYDGYRAMYEGAQTERMGLLIWMSHPCWPSMVWSTYDYYLEPTGAYFGAKKACEPLHVQYDEATGDVQVVNIAAGRHDSLTVIAQRLDMTGNITGQWQRPVAIDNDQTVVAMNIGTPNQEAAYVRLLCVEHGRSPLENFYVCGSDDSVRLALAELPKVALRKTEHWTSDGDSHTGRILVSNPNGTPAMLVRLNLKGSDDEQILPAIYSDNYFHLMPGEERMVTITYSEEDGRGAKPTVELTAFNAKH